MCFSFSRLLSLLEPLSPLLPTSNDVDFVIHNGSRSRHILHCSVLHLKPHVPGNVIHLHNQDGAGVKGNR